MGPACAHNTYSLEGDASIRLHCPESKLSSRERGGEYAVQGCGKSVTCSRNWQSLEYWCSDPVPLGEAATK